MATCLNCGIEYEPDDTEGRSRYWCSKRCMDDAKADFLYDKMKDEGRTNFGEQRDNLLPKET